MSARFLNQDPYCVDRHPLDLYLSAISHLEAPIGGQSVNVDCATFRCRYFVISIDYGNPSITTHSILTIIQNDLEQQKNQKIEQALVLRARAVSTAWW